MSWTKLILICSTALLALSASKIQAADSYQIIEIGAGQTADAYFEINLSGRVFVRIVAEPGGENCASFWWIKWPLGNIGDLGRVCDRADFEIPAWTSFAFASKLRVGGSRNRIKLVISADEQIAHSVVIHF